MIQWLVSILGTFTAVARLQNTHPSSRTASPNLYVVQLNYSGIGTCTIVFGPIQPVYDRRSLRVNRNRRSRAMYWCLHPRIECIITARILHFTPDAAKTATTTFATFRAVMGLWRAVWNPALFPCRTWRRVVGILPDKRCSLVDVSAYVRYALLYPS